MSGLRRWWIFPGVTCAVAIALVACGAQTFGGAAPHDGLVGSRSRGRVCTGAAAPARYDHVVVVVMENKTWSGVLNGQGPWLTARQKECASATNYQQAGSPSRPNYIALTAGATYGCAGSNSDPPGGCTPPSPSVFKQVIDAGGTAKNYLGGAQSPCDLTSGARTR